MSLPNWHLHASAVNSFATNVSGWFTATTGVASVINSFPTEHGTGIFAEGVYHFQPSHQRYVAFFHQFKVMAMKRVIFWDQFNFQLPPRYHSRLS